MAVFLNVSCFVFEQSIVFQNIYNIFYFKTSSIFNSVKKQSGIGFIVDALFGYFTYLHSLYAVVELRINFVLIHFGRQPTHYANFFLANYYACLPFLRIIENQCSVLAKCN